MNMLHYSTLLYLIIATRCISAIDNGDGRMLQDQDDQDEINDSVFDILEDTDLVDQQFTGLLKTLGFNETILSAMSNSTVFAPSPGALEDALGADFLEALATQDWRLHRRNLISFHLNPISYPLSELPSDFIVMWNQERLFIESGDAAPRQADDIDVSLVYDEPSGARSLVVEADIESENGIVHIVDKALLPSFTRRSAMDLWFEQYGIWNDAMEAVKLDDQFRDPSNIHTLFVPSNTAFDATLTPEEIDFLFQPEQEDLMKDFLLDHAVEGIYTMEDITTDTVLTNLNGREITFSREVSDTWEGVRFVLNDQASIEFPDFLVSNGIVHGLDKALLRPEVDVLGKAAKFLSSSATAAKFWTSLTLLPLLVGMLS